MHTQISRAGTDCQQKFQRRVSHRSMYLSGSVVRGTWIALLLLVACQTTFESVSAGDSDEPPSLILHTGKIYTVDEALPWAQAVAIRDDVIVAVGNNDEILPLAGDATRLIDLDGRLVLPGFIDTHVHLASAARFHEFNLMTTSSQDEFVDKIQRLTETLVPGEWITGGLWGAYDQWQLGSDGSQSQAEPFAPQMELIENMTEEHPVLIRRFDNSQYAANRLALEKAGIDADNPAPVDGIEFMRDAEGRFTGHMRGTGVTRHFRGVMPEDANYDRRLDQTRYALRMAAQYGVTTVSDMSDDTQLTIYRDLRERGELTLRIDFRYTLDRWEEVANRGIRVGSGDEWIRLGSLKGFIDGIMGTSSARFFEPYDHQPDNRGRWRNMMIDAEGDVDPEKFFAYMQGADEAGLQITVHAIGDEANHVLMNFVERLNEINGERDRRFRLVHAQVVGEDDFRRLGELGILAEVQPFHLSDDMRWMEERIGTERCQGAYAFKRIHDSGARLCFGSDWPGTSAAEYPINPLLALYAAVTRQTVNGTPEQGWFPEQKLDLGLAIKAHTLDAAYALFEEELKGSISDGKLADLVVLSEDLFEIAPHEILDVQVVYTVVGGEVVYESPRQ